MFASIEDSDSDHGEDSSSNTSADDHMTTKGSQCCLQGAGVKEVRRLKATLNEGGGKGGNILIHLCHFYG